MVNINPGTYLSSSIFQVEKDIVVKAFVTEPPVKRLDKSILLRFIWLDEFDLNVVIFGPSTYELMFPYWPDVARANSGSTKADNEFAHAFTAVPRVAVVSKTLPQPEAANVTVIRSNLESEVLRLKKESRKNISTGGVTLPSELLDLGLIDEFHIVVHPVLAGKGRRLFEDATLKDKMKLKLVDSRVFKSGIIAHHYLKQ